MKDASSFSYDTFAMLGTSVPTQKLLWLISSHHGCRVRFLTGETSDTSTRIFTLSTAEPLLLLVPVKCFEVGLFQSNSASLENAPQSSHASHSIPPHPISMAACRDCLRVVPEVCVGGGLIFWGCLSAGVLSAQEAGFRCPFLQDCCICAVPGTPWDSQGRLGIAPHNAHSLLMYFSSF